MNDRDANAPSQISHNSISLKSISLNLSKRKPLSDIHCENKAASIPNKCTDRIQCDKQKKSKFNDNAQKPQFFEPTAIFHHPKKIDIAQEEKRELLRQMSSDSMDISSDAKQENAFEKFYRNSRQKINYDYTQQIHSNLKFSEKKIKINPEIFKHSPQLRWQMREILIDWLHEVCGEYDLHWQTMLLTVQIVDRYLSGTTVYKKNLQLLGITSMWIAAKFEEIHPPQVHDFVYMSDNAYEYLQVIQFEEKVLKKLKWRVVAPTPNDFLCHYFIFIKQSEQKPTKILSQLFVDISMQCEFYCAYPSSQLAAAAVLLAALYNHARAMPIVPEFSAHCECSIESLLVIAEKINTTFVRLKKRSGLRSALDKHKKRCGKIPAKPFADLVQHLKC